MIQFKQSTNSTFCTSAPLGLEKETTLRRTEAKRSEGGSWRVCRVMRKRRHTMHAGPVWPGSVDTAGAVVQRLVDEVVAFHAEHLGALGALQRHIPSGVDGPLAAEA